MNDLMKKFFPEGQRKLLVSLIAMAIAIGFEKFTKQGLSEEMKTSLIAIVAIFTGGNVMEHIANAFKVFKGTKVGQVIEDVLPGDQGLGADVEIQKEENYSDPLESRVGEIEVALNQTNKNVQVILQHLQRQNQPQQPKQPGA